MIDEALLKEYRKARTWLEAKYALRRARWRVNHPLPDFEPSNDYMSTSALVELDGLTFRVTISQDIYGEVDPAPEIKDYQFEGAIQTNIRADWQHRQWPYHDEQRKWWRSGNSEEGPRDLARYYNGKGGMSKAVAWDKAMESYRKQMESELEAMGYNRVFGSDPSDYSFYIVNVEVVHDDLEVGGASLGMGSPIHYREVEEEAWDLAWDYDLFGEARDEAEKQLPILVKEAENRIHQYMEMQAAL